MYSNSKRHLHKWLGDSHGLSRKPDRSLRSFFFCNSDLETWDPCKNHQAVFCTKKRKRFSGTVGIEASNCHPQKHQITQHICNATAWSLTNLWKFQWIWKNIKRHLSRISGKFPQATIRTFASLASRGGGSPLRRCGPWQLFVGYVGDRNPKPPRFFRDCGNKPLMWIPKINNSCISKAHLANPPKSPGFTVATGVRRLRQTEWPLRCLPCASWSAGSWTGGDDLLGNFFTKLVVQQENGSNEGRRVVVKPYQGIFTMDDTPEVCT